MNADGSADHIRQTLTDFLGFTDAAARLVTRGRDAYDDDEMLRLAAEAIMHKIGEAVSRLPDEFTQGQPKVRWRSMRGTRNLIAHQYEVVDHALLWAALERSLPQDVAEVRSILDRLG